MKPNVDFRREVLFMLNTIAVVDIVVYIVPLDAGLLQFPMHNDNFIDF